MRILNLTADGHVHVYPFMSIQNVLDSARRNFSKCCELAKQSDAMGLLFVADPEGVNGYDRFVSISSNGGPEAAEDWTRLYNDSRSVTLQHSSGAVITAVKGQQLITSEGLEVLGMGYDATLKSGLSLSSTVAKIRLAGGWSLLAWGAGKWLGRRGRLVNDLIIAERGSTDIMLADNGGRPWIWARVPQFDIAKAEGMRILAGTEPLPLKGEEYRIGSYGFSHRVECDIDESLVDAYSRMLQKRDNESQLFGPRMGVSRFVAKQVNLRLRPVRHSRENQ